MNEEKATSTDLKQEEFTTQERSGFRTNWPAWMKQLPRLRFPKQRSDYELIPEKELKQVLSDVDPSAVERILEDMKFMDHELLRLFRERDYRASVQQNRYRLYQIGFMLLAAIATVIGSLQALWLTGNPNIVPLLAFIETVIALLTTYLATISGRESPLPQWLTNRRRAEYLRREYFRYLADAPPYDQLKGYERQQKLSTRAANINRGFFPDQDTDK